MTLDYLVKRYGSKIILSCSIAAPFACQSQTVNVGDDKVSTVSGIVDVLFDEQTIVGISQAPVEIRESQYSITGNDTTDANGSFSLGNIPPGNYELVVKNIGSEGYCSDVSSLLRGEVDPTEVTILGYDACVLGYVTEIQVEDYDKTHDVRLGTTSKITKINLSVTGSEPSIDSYYISWGTRYTTIESGSSFEILLYTTENANLDEYGRGVWDDSKFIFQIHADSWRYTNGSNCQDFADWAKDGEIKVYFDDTIIKPSEDSRNADADYALGTITYDSFGPFIYEFNLLVNYNVNLEPC